MSFVNVTQAILNEHDEWEGAYGGNGWAEAMAAGGTRTGLPMSRDKRDLFEIFIRVLGKWVIVMPLKRKPPDKYVLLD